MFSFVETDTHTNKDEKRDERQRGYRAVSYTHLDVYKRQVYYVIGNKEVVCY